MLAVFNQLIRLCLVLMLCLTLLGCTTSHTLTDQLQHEYEHDAGYVLTSPDRKQLSKVSASIRPRINIQYGSVVLVFLDSRCETCDEFKKFIHERDCMSHSSIVIVETGPLANGQYNSTQGIRVPVPLAIWLEDSFVINVFSASDL